MTSLIKEANMYNNKRISLAVIKRLPRYYRYLGNLLDDGVTRISSKELSKIMSITASQIRQDLNNFGCFGQQGYGYDVGLLYMEIKKILGLDSAYSMIIVGAGNIGQALANYTSFEKRGFNFIAIFDSNPILVGMSIREVKIYDIDYLEEFLENNKIDIGVLALPKESARKTAGILIKNNVKGIWNFSSLELELPDNVMVENVHLTDSLMRLSYKLNERKIMDNINNIKA